MLLVGLGEKLKKLDEEKAKSNESTPKSTPTDVDSDDEHFNDLCDELTDALKASDPVEAAKTIIRVAKMYARKK